MIVEKMSEGELKKRLFNKRDSVCWECTIRASYEELEENYKPKTCKTKREPTKEEMLQVLDEAKKEFPKGEDYTIDKYGALLSRRLALIEDRETWFKKWFGE
jgi:hypothetical protein